MAVLTDREKDVLLRTAKGESPQTIGSALSIRPRTVELHLASVRDKLRVSSDEAAITAAQDNNLIPKQLPMS